MFYLQFFNPEGTVIARGHSLAVPRVGEKYVLTIDGQTRPRRVCDVIWGVGGNLHQSVPEQRANVVIVDVNDAPPLDAGWVRERLRSFCDRHGYSENSEFGTAAYEIAKDLGLTAAS